MCVCVRVDAFWMIWLICSYVVVFLEVCVRVCVFVCVCLCVCVCACVCGCVVELFCSGCGLLFVECVRGSVS